MILWFRFKGILLVVSNMVFLVAPFHFINSLNVVFSYLCRRRHHFNVRILWRRNGVSWRSFLSWRTWRDGSIFRRRADHVFLTVPSQIFFDLANCVSVINWRWIMIYDSNFNRFLTDFSRLVYVSDLFYCVVVNLLVSSDSNKKQKGIELGFSYFALDIIWRDGHSNTLRNRVIYHKQIQYVPWFNRVGSLIWSSSIVHVKTQDFMQNIDKTYRSTSKTLH